ncbi:hypothetical protein [Caldisalinibacter kiritimatiensis]|uniref:Uncharacterized protein n=1 Tax=Caldisalinibacter kiritimatiensis TaxID=1304284 RepID=R1AWS5_9FIRM|nr:hypothetical protein [Caldisalinibacter kiritimatiensis]EOD01092.1 hypothetical protein L21TH_0855 [Caldisalinibacter kiritimatiensis]
MIQIDDAGSGSLIGGTCIGILRVETGEYEYEFIPVKFYSKKYFKTKLYLDYVVTIVKRLFKLLNVKKSEKIYVCRGYMFDKLRLWFDENNYIYESTKITNPLQDKIESTFEQYAISFGLPEEFIRYTKYPFHFHRILKWVYADYDKRKKLCKTGWKSWSKYENLKTIIETDYIVKSNYVCLKCGAPIKNNSKVIRIKYVSNRPTSIYLHYKCQ